MKKIILVSITGNNYKECEEKIDEVKKREISKIALFFQYLSSEERKKIYKKLKETEIKEIPLVHIGEGVEKDEVKFLFEKYKSRYFTIHENDFLHLSNWRGFYDHLFLEMSTDNIVDKSVDVEKIGGFCVDLAHYQKQKDRKTIDYEYVYNRRSKKTLFRCNHLSGYSSQEMEDMHYVNSVNDFNYIKNLPDFVFGGIIAIEVNNSIKEQLKFKKEIEKTLNEKFNT